MTGSPVKIGAQHLTFASTPFASLRHEEARALFCDLHSAGEPLARCRTAAGMVDLFLGELHLTLARLSERATVPASGGMENAPCCSLPIGSALG
jgi:hypothetical protein